jgi:predicted restriction endonuclease
MTADVDLLQETLIIHLKQLNVTMTKYARKEFVKSLLEKQNHKCVFGKNVGHIYCSSDLEWGYIKPLSRKEEQSVDNLYLLCAICKAEIYI